MFPKFIRILSSIAMASVRPSPFVISKVGRLKFSKTRPFAVLKYFGLIQVAVVKRSHSSVPIRSQYIGSIGLIVTFFQEFQKSRHVLKSLICNDIAFV